MSGLGIIGAALAAGLSGAGEGIARGAASQMEEEAKTREIQAQAEEQRRTHQENTTFDQNLSDQYRRKVMDEIIAGAQPELQGIIAANAQTGPKSKVDYTTEDDPTQASYDQMQPEDQTDPAYQPTPQQEQDALVRSGVRAGHIPLAEVMKNTSKNDIAMLGFQAKLDKADTLTKIAELSAASRVEVANVRADVMRERMENGEAKKSTLNTQLNSETQNIKANTQMIHFLTVQLDSPSTMTDPKKAAMLNDQIADLWDEIKISKATKNKVLQQLGLPTSDDVAKPAKSGANPAVPKVDELFPPKNK